IASLWLPPEISLFATACWLGVWLGIGWKVVYTRILHTRRFISAGETPSRISYATAMLVGAALLFPLQNLPAQALPPQVQPAARVADPSVVEVLIPVDPQGVPSETQYFVPATFWEQALREAQR